MTRSRLSTLAALFAALLLTAAGVALAQNPASGAPGDAAQRPRRAAPTPVNLQVLPKDASGEQVIKIMRQFAGDLGVECGYCHAKDSETGRLNFPSDANPMKNTARVMMRMTDTIDATYLTQLNVPKPATPVTCGTCHRGMAEPAVFVPQPRGRGPRPGAAPAPGDSAPSPN